MGVDCMHIWQECKQWEQTKIKIKYKNIKLKKGEKEKSWLVFHFMNLSAVASNVVKG